VRYLHDYWSYVVLNFDVKETFGWVWKDVYDVGFGWNVCMGFAETSFCEGRVKDERIDIRL
jgi:hypothetical protein